MIEKPDFGLHQLLLLYKIIDITEQIFRYHPSLVKSDRKDCESWLGRPLSENNFLTSQIAKFFNLTFVPRPLDKCWKISMFRMSFDVT